MSMEMILNTVSLDFSFFNIDAFSASIALVGYAVVFSVLVLMFFVVLKLPKIIKYDYMALFSGNRKSEEKPVKKDDLNISGEVNAAISMALFLHFSEMHDEESGVITIKKVSKRYSPWSSKIYGLNPSPR